MRLADVPSERLRRDAERGDDEARLELLRRDTRHGRTLTDGDWQEACVRWTTGGRRHVYYMRRGSLDLHSTPDPNLGENASAAICSRWGGNVPRGFDSQETRGGLYISLHAAFAIDTYVGRYHRTLYPSRMILVPLCELGIVRVLQFKGPWGRRRAVPPDLAHVTDLEVGGVSAPMQPFYDHLNRLFPLGPS